MAKKDVNMIVVMGEKILTKIEEVDIFEINYWRENPRVNSVIKQEYGDRTVSDEEIECELWKKSSVKDLFQDIEKHAGLIDEILIKDNIVLEGNSRLCAYRRLYKRAKDNGDKDGMQKWSKIRARILPKDTSEKLIFSILGTWHIKGKAEWDTYEKAAYLKRLKLDYGYPSKEIASTISESVKFVEDHIRAYDMMVENRIYSLEKFSYFYELTKNKRIKDLSSEDPEIIPKAIEAIKDELFEKAQEIRDLPKVLKDKKAKKIFMNEKKRFSDVLLIAKDRHPEYEESFYSIIKKVTRELEECSIEKIEEIKIEAEKKYLFERLHRIISSFCKKLGIRS